IFCWHVFCIKQFVQVNNESDTAGSTSVFYLMKRISEIQNLKTSQGWHHEKRCTMDTFLIAAAVFFAVNAFVFVTYLRKIDVNGQAVRQLEKAQFADAYNRQSAKVRKARASGVAARA
ncbi:MAG: hypothetical protein KJ930_11230, partial [Gammaproteobacteria bacterium]|nr:hypothetical protein [Gammaproteobacteria bacterium]